MSFDVRSDSQDILAPVYTFPGDEAVGPEAYGQAIFVKYLSSAISVYGAAEAYQIGVDAPTFERWKRICAGTSVLDVLLDDSASLEQAHEDYQRHITALFDDEAADQAKEQPLDDALTLLKNSLAVLPETRRANLLESARDLGRIALEKARCNEVADYIKILQQEAFHSYVLISEAATEEVRSHENFPRFEHWVQNGLYMGELGDSCWDLWHDSRHGLVGVEPSLSNCLKIAGELKDPLKTILFSKASYAGLWARFRFSLLPTFYIVKKYMGNEPEPQEISSSDPESLAA